MLASGSWPCTRRHSHNGVSQCPWILHEPVPIAQPRTVPGHRSSPPPLPLACCSTNSMTRTSRGWPQFNQHGKPCNDGVRHPPQDSISSVLPRNSDCGSMLPTCSFRRASETLFRSPSAFLRSNACSFAVAISASSCRKRPAEVTVGAAGHARTRPGPSPQLCSLRALNLRSNSRDRPRDTQLRDAVCCFSELTL